LIIDRYIYRQFSVFYAVVTPITDETLNQRTVGLLPEFNHIGWFFSAITATDFTLYVGYIAVRAGGLGLEPPVQVCDVEFNMKRIIIAALMVSVASTAFAADLPLYLSVAYRREAGEVKDGGQPEPPQGG
jgi:hypothetical protein